ncbi:MAG: cell wall anchor protein [Opitutaceae bacterium]|jgi:hypothetical protein|nr:cell wall anchor protein [Opitutaceae bacterium]
MKTKRISHIAITVAAAAATVAIVSLPASSSAIAATPAPVLSETFESGMTGWTGWSGGVTSWFTTPDPLDTGNTVLSSSTTGRTEAIIKNITTIQKSLDFSFDIYSGSAATGWNFRGVLLTGVMSTSPGYGFYITAGGGVSIYRYDSGWSTLNGGTPAPVEIGNSSAASVWKNDEWNTVSFRWLETGDFSLFVNGSIVATASDATYKTKAARLVFQKFTNNDESKEITGRILLFDNVTVTTAPIPEPATTAIVLPFFILLAIGVRQICRACR